MEVQMRESNKKILSWGVVFFLLILSVGCKNGDDLVYDPNGALLEYLGCKGAATGVGLSSFQSTDEDCIQYKYDGEGTLTLQHINAGFNCCPGVISAVIQFNGNTITILEQEEKADCKCNCLFDLNYEITGLVPGAYLLQVFEPYVEDGDAILAVTLEIPDNAQTGSFCLTRPYYPWNQ